MAPLTLLLLNWVHLLYVSNLTIRREIWKFKYREEVVQYSILTTITDMGKTMKLSKKQLEIAFTEVEKEKFLYSQALHDLINNKVRWIHKWTEKNCGTYKFGVSRLTGACGGIFYRVYETTGQSKDADITYLDNIQVYGDTEYNVELKIALAAARALRKHEIDKKGEYNEHTS